MISPERLYVTVALFAALAASLTAICSAWSVPSWRARLARRPVRVQAHELTGWSGHTGIGLVSVAMAAAASMAWWGFYVVLTAVL